MGRKQGPRKGSLQFWPRKRAEKILNRVNWKPIISKKQERLEKGDKDNKTNFLGFIGYKAGMASAFVKDNTPDSMTKNKRIIVPVTIIECPSMKILSVRFYKNGKVFKETLNDNLDKELIRTIRLPGKNKKSNVKETIEKLEKENKEAIEDLRIIAYSEAKKTQIKKVPDISELGLTGTFQEKLAFAKEHLSKEISISDVFSKGIVDIRGLTTGKGFQGTVKRFGIRLRFHKSEKGIRRVGSIGAWHPTGVKFRVPMPGQMGYQSRITYNLPIIASKKFSSEDSISKRIFSGFGNLNTDYLILAGSIQGPAKRQVLITSSLRPTKRQIKRNYELLELR